MKYIEQLLEDNKPVNLWLYLPFPLFFVGLMFVNWIGTQMLGQPTSESRPYGFYVIAVFSMDLRSAKTKFKESNYGSEKDRF